MTRKGIDRRRRTQCEQHSGVRENGKRRLRPIEHPADLCSAEHEYRSQKGGPRAGQPHEEPRKAERYTADPLFFVRDAAPDERHQRADDREMLAGERKQMGTPCLLKKVLEFSVELIPDTEKQGLGKRTGPAGRREMPWQSSPRAAPAAAQRAPLPSLVGCRAHRPR